MEQVIEQTTQQILVEGVSAHKQGNLQEAERLYRKILQENPIHPDANHNLGLIGVSVNKVEEALPLLKNALEQHPNIELFWVSYIEALIKAKQFEAAKQAIEQGQNYELSEEKINFFKTKITHNQTNNIQNPSELEIK